MAKNVVRVRSRYDERETELDAPGIVCGPTMTKQSEAAACDINWIVDRFAKTGELPGLIKENPEYGDFSTLGDYQRCLEVVMKAQEQFEALDPRVRGRFQNDPARFLEFATDPANLKEMVKMGLAVEKPETKGEVPTGGSSPANGSTAASGAAGSPPSKG